MKLAIVYQLPPLNRIVVIASLCRLLWSAGLLGHCDDWAARGHRPSLYGAVAQCVSRRAVAAPGRAVKDPVATRRRLPTYHRSRGALAPPNTSQ